MKFKIFQLVFVLTLGRVSGVVMEEFSQVYLDRGLADVTPPEQTETNTAYKMHLYQRVKLNFNQNSRIALHYGLHNDTLTTASLLDFRLDLSSKNVLINLNQQKCDEEEGCKKLEDGKKETATYNETQYTYFNAQGFLGANRIRPGEIEATSSEISHFTKLPMRFYNEDKLEENILGLAPNAELWNYWRGLYHFPATHINFTVCYNKNNEYVLYDSFIDMNNEILFKVKKSESQYRFPGVINYLDNEVAAPNEAIKVCIDNKQNITMRLSDNLYNNIKKALCKSPEDCGKPSGLKENPNVNLELKLEDHARRGNYFAINFKNSALYKTVGDSIIWKIDKLSAEEKAGGCHIVLEQDFLAEKYLLISNNLADEEHLYVGFKIMDPADFAKLNFYNVTMIILALATTSLLIIFLILNSKLNKLLKRENQL